MLDAVAAGKHVLCEKAIALNAAEAAEMFPAAADAGVLLMEAMWMRFCPFIATLDELIADGAIVAGRNGRLRVHAPFHHSPAITLERRGDVVATYDTSFAGHGFRFEIADAERCVAAGLTESLLRPAADTLAVMEWMDAIRRRVGVVFRGEAE